MIDLAFATTSNAIDFKQSYDISDIIRVGVALVVLFSWLVSVIFIIWGWVMLILSWWKEEKVKPAMNSIRYAIIWLIIIIISIFLLPKVWDMLKLGVSKYISPDAIFSTIQKLSTQFFWSNEDIILDTWNTSNSLPADFSDL